MKPRIRKGAIDPIVYLYHPDAWSCASKWYTGIGVTPKAAYENWKTQEDAYFSCQKIAKRKTLFQVLPRWLSAIF